MRALYTLLWYLALPLLPLRLWWRGRREPGYREHIGERFGRYRDDARAGARPVLWVHAVSLGETRAARAARRAAAARAYPEATVLLTHMTATGRAAGRALFGDARRAGVAALRRAVRGARASSRTSRRAPALIMETELWPNLVALAHARACRSSSSTRACRSDRRPATRAFPSLTRPMLAALAGVAAQAEADAARLAALGAPAPVVTGNLKFDVGVPDAALALGRELRVRFGETRPVWVAGSTRDGEEALILDALAARALPPATLTVIVPRHPQRFAAVAELLRQRGIPFVAPQRQRAGACRHRASCSAIRWARWLAYYAAADVVFVGGSLLPLGGQNLIEPIAVGRPTLVGPHMFNFAEATAKARAAGAALEVADAGGAGRGGRRAARRPGAARGDARGRARLPRGAPRRGGPPVGVARAAARAGDGTSEAPAAPRSRQPLSWRLMSSTSCSDSVPTACLQPQHADQVLEVRLREVAPRREHVLLHVQHVEVRAHADFLAELVRLAARPAPRPPPARTP